MAAASGRPGPGRRRRWRWRRTTAGRSTSCRISSPTATAFGIHTVADDCTREYLALVPDSSLSGTRVARELDRLVMERGRPKMVVRTSSLIAARQAPVATTAQPGKSNSRGELRAG